MIKPPTLLPGDTIGVFAPSSRVDTGQIQRGAAILEEHGYQVHIHPQTYAEYGQSAGTAQEKTQAFHDLWTDPSIKAVIAARGGNQADEMLSLIDYDLIKSTPKILLGFSDITFLLNALHKKTGLITFHGPVVNSLGIGKPGKQDIDQCFAFLSGQADATSLSGSEVLSPGQAEGPLLGGNLSLVCALLGTPYAPDFNGAILFLEDVNTETSHTSTHFTHLRNAGILDQVSGLLCGQFTNPKDTGTLPFEKTVENIIREHTAPYGLPVIMDAPFGHDGDLPTFPVGARVKLEATDDGTTLTLAEPAVLP